MEIVTDRLLLRPFEEQDRLPNAAIFADPEVRRFALGMLDSTAANARMDRAIAEYATLGTGMLAAIDKQSGLFIGMLGLTGFGLSLRAATGSSAQIQIAWQLARPVWGQGLATEGARAVIDYAFDKLGQSEIVAITATTNLPSRRVMEKIGMRYDADADFMHPEIPPDHPLAPHVLYAIKAGRAVM
nr:GNAT family N-acetyltransferase [uncultured Devosia sp.]